MYYSGAHGPDGRSNASRDRGDGPQTAGGGIVANRISLRRGRRQGQERCWKVPEPSKGAAVGAFSRSSSSAVTCVRDASRTSRGPLEAMHYSDDGVVAEGVNRVSRFWGGNGRGLYTGWAVKPSKFMRLNCHGPSSGARVRAGDPETGSDSSSGEPASSSFGLYYAVPAVARKLAAYPRGGAW